MAAAQRYLRYVPGTDEFETLDVSPAGTVAGRVKTATADQMRRQGGYQLVSDNQWGQVQQEVAARQVASAVPPPTPAGPQPSAYGVALLNEAEGRPGMGPQSVADLAADEMAARTFPVRRTDISGPAEVVELMRLSDPNAPDAVAALGQGVGLSTRRPLEFSGFRGDPAVVVRQPDGTSTPGGVNMTPYAASPERGGNAPPIEQPRRGLMPEDAAIPAPPAAATSSTSSSVRFTAGAPSKGQKELADAFAQQREAVAARAALSEQEAAAEQARLDVELNAQRSRQQREEESAAIRRESALAAEGRLTDAIKALSEPSGEIDPNRWWNSRSTGQRIAAFASAFMTGFAGRPSVIQQFIDQDIAAQRFNLERGDKKKAQAVEGQKLLLGTMRDRFQDEILAEQAARLAATQYAQKVAERETAGFKGQEAQVLKQQLQGALAQQEVEAKQAFQARAAQLGLQQAELNLRTAQFQAQQQQVRAGAAAEMGGSVPISSLTPDQKKRAVTIAPGRAVLALNEDAAKKAQEGWLSGQQTLRVLDEAIALRREFGPEVLPTAGKKKLQSAGTELIGALNRRNRFGALDKGTQELLEQMAGGELTSVGQVIPVLERLRSGVAQDMGEEFQTYTGQPFGGTGSFQPRR